MALIGLGYRSLSMSAAAIGPVKAMTNAVHAGKVAEKLEAILDDSNAADGVRAMLTDFAEAEAIPL